MYLHTVNLREYDGSKAFETMIKSAGRDCEVIMLAFGKDPLPHIPVDPAWTGRTNGNISLMRRCVDRALKHCLSEGDTLRKSVDALESVVDRTDGPSEALAAVATTMAAVKTAVLESAALVSLQRSSVSKSLAKLRHRTPITCSWLKVWNRDTKWTSLGNRWRESWAELDEDRILLASSPGAPRKGRRSILLSDIQGIAVKMVSLALDVKIDLTPPWIFH
jgi:hypothetical protein